MMSYAAAAQRNGFLLAVVHIVNRDWGELVRVYQRLGFIPEGTDLKPIELALEGAMPDVLNADVQELNIKNIFNKLGDIMYKFPCKLFSILSVYVTTKDSVTNQLRSLSSSLLHCHYSVLGSIGRACYPG
jgi:predicted unusual protein kinase regulating ubiquinone biosynthesis (AarF/ABC1/UbiB family)